MRLLIVLKLILVLGLNAAAILFWLKGIRVAASVVTYNGVEALANELQRLGASL